MHCTAEEAHDAVLSKAETALKARVRKHTLLKVMWAAGKIQNLL